MSWHWPWWKIVLAFFGVIILLTGLWFGSQFLHYYRAIRSGAINPLLEQNLQSSFSRMAANAKVTPQDLARLTSPDAPTRGKSNAKLTIVEFLDFDCPFCGSAFVPLKDALTKHKDQIYFVVRDFPIEELHPRALRSALAARCAQGQGKYWPYHDLLFAAQDRHEEADLERNAELAGLNVNAFRQCYQSEQFKEKVLSDIRDGLQVGVQGTPTFFFNGVKVQGALDQKTFEFLIERFLKL